MMRDAVPKRYKSIMGNTKRTSKWGKSLKKAHSGYVDAPEKPGGFEQAVDRYLKSFDLDVLIDINKRYPKTN